MPVLGLAAGALLAKLWTVQLTSLIVTAGFVIEKPPLSSIVAILLILLPALVAEAKAPKVHTARARIFASIIFALAALIMTYDAFLAAVVLDEASKSMLQQITPYSTITLTLCIALALIDVLNDRKHSSHH